MQPATNVFGTVDLQWARPDVRAIVEHHGLGSVSRTAYSEHRAWLVSHGYEHAPVDCKGGIAGVLGQFNALFRWREQFGYELAVGHANLDAIRDGFEFNFVPPRGMVIELLGVDELFREDPRWASGLLAIASEHSLYHLAHGRRFFCLLVLDDDSRLPGLVVERISVPGPYWNPSGRLPG